MAATSQAVIITGAARGIGRACARRLAHSGFRVYAGVRSVADGDALRAELGSPIVPVLIDVAKDETIARGAAFIESDLANLQLTGLINNAGIAVAGPIEFLPLPELRRQFEVNVIGQVAVIQAVMPLLRRARGRIINMGSISGRSALPLTGAYAASKFALEAITDSLRVELQPWGIDVVIIEPGVIATPIWRTSIAAAEKLLPLLPPRALDYYGALIERVRARANTGPERGLPADEVARVVERALTARRPRTRYLVGRDAAVRALLEELPDRWRDRIIARRLARI